MFCDNTAGVNACLTLEKDEHLPFTFAHQQQYTPHLAEEHHLHRCTHKYTGLKVHLFIPKCLCLQHLFKWFVLHFSSD